VWELHNFTEDAHPIQIHLVQFEVLSRQAFDGPATAPEPWERGTKDTVISRPDEITRVKARFGIAGRYVWHCHIIDHKDNEMMRPYGSGDGGGRTSDRLRVSCPRAAGLPARGTTVRWRSVLRADRHGGLAVEGVGLAEPDVAAVHPDQADAEFTGGVGRSTMNPSGLVCAGGHSTPSRCTPRRRGEAER
jgi:hypothetical protein